jgi:hypothetical protein
MDNIICLNTMLLFRTIIVMLPKFACRDRAEPPVMLLLMMSKVAFTPVPVIVNAFLNSHNRTIVVLLTNAFDMTALPKARLRSMIAVAALSTSAPAAAVLKVQSEYCTELDAKGIEIVSAKVQFWKMNETSFTGGAAAPATRNTIGARNSQLTKAAPNGGDATVAGGVGESITKSCRVVRTSPLQVTNSATAPGWSPASRTLTNTAHTRVWRLPIIGVLVFRT